METTNEVGTNGLGLLRSKYLKMITTANLVSTDK
jgi:hypothetical protein